jgi:hypothetical protein
MSESIYVPLILDGFEFDNYWMETPEHLGDLGGAISVQQHDFPGGIRTQRNYGYFPGVIHWRARFSGGLASMRVEEVKRKLVAGTEITLSWGERRWAGLLVRFAPVARHTWLFEYDIEFWPRIDLSSGYGETGGEPSPEELMDLQMLALNSFLSGSSVTLFPSVADVLTDPIISVMAAVNLGLSAAGGLVAFISDIQRLAINVQIDALLFVATPLLDSLDALVTSPVWDIYSSILCIRNLIQTIKSARWVVPAVNPNLMLLSAQYYGDATLWQTIGDANGLYDPQPIGEFQIAIPAPVVTI